MSSVFSDQDRNSAIKHTKHAYSTYSCTDFVTFHLGFPTLMQWYCYKVLQGTQHSGVSEHPVSSAGMSQHKVKKRGHCQA